jgi:hypothetical protein
METKDQIIVDINDFFSDFESRSPQEALAGLEEIREAVTTNIDALREDMDQPLPGSTEDYRGGQDG